MSDVHHDEAVLRLLAGARFGPNSRLILPSGKQLTGQEARVLTSFYLDSYDRSTATTGTAVVRAADGKLPDGGGTDDR